MDDRRRLTSLSLLHVLATGNKKASLKKQFPAVPRCHGGAACTQLLARVVTRNERRPKASRSAGPRSTPATHPLLPHLFLLIGRSPGVSAS